MRIFTILACLALSIGSSWATTLGEHTSGHFCYTEETCGPKTWPGVCATGIRQSFVDLPAKAQTQGKFPLNKKAYKGQSFRMQNNGHSVSIDFAGQDSTLNTNNFTFPDLIDASINRQYKLASIHFHWGTSDNTTGSEHCIAGACSAFEIHFVHYLANYSDMASAVASENESALSVVGVLVNVNVFKSLAASLAERLNATIPGQLDCFAPVVRNLKRVEIADSHFETIDEPIDFSNCIAPGANPEVYTYKGSLTTPGCNEQVNWYVMKNKATTSHQDLEAFRSVLKDSEGEELLENHRPTQDLSGRVVYLAPVTTAPSARQPLPLLNKLTGLLRG